jgi:hypothetical protein
MTEAEALKRFIPILGRISTPGDRATITRNILERIAGQQTCIMGVSHKQAGALAWPNDHVKALAFEHALNMAVDAGEFVSLIHRADRRHFQIEELSAWPNCPKIDTESPLTFWLSDAVQAATTSGPAQTPATPAPVAVVALVEPDKTGPKFSMTKAAMVAQHKHQWPTIARDMNDASTNGLAAAKAGPRGWYEPDALEWARANNKMANTSNPASSLANAMRSMGSLTGRKHTLEG